MAEVKAAEVSAILKQQLTGFDSSVSLDEVDRYSKWVTVLLVYTVYPMCNMANW